MQCLWHILGSKWTIRVTNKEVLDSGNIPNLFMLHRQSWLCWHGLFYGLKHGWILKDFLYGELAIGKRAQGHPHLCFKDICKQDMKVQEGPTTVSFSCMVCTQLPGGVATSDWTQVDILFPLPSPTEPQIVQTPFTGETEYLNFHFHCRKIHSTVISFTVFRYLNGLLSVNIT